MLKRLCFLVLLALAVAPSASASPYVRFGMHDDAWLAFGPGTLEERLDKLEAIGVELVRFNLRWDEIAREQPSEARSPGDPAYHWGAADAVLKGLRDRGIPGVVGIVGTPSWANGGRGPARAPRSKWSFRNFAAAAAARYPWVRHWLIWNEPNQQRWLRPASPRLYTRKLLNPAYEAIHAVNPRARVGGGVTAPRGLRGGVSPVDWIRGMKRAGAKLDAYAHHPYPASRFETPTSGGCNHCETITMATIERLLSETRRAFGRTRIWLTEYGYQTNPPDRLIGVSHRKQAEFIGSASRRVRLAPRVDMLIHFMYRDDEDLGRWQSGLERANGANKLAMRAFPLPFTQVSRKGRRTAVWGQVRPRSDRQTYRLQVRREGRWRWAGGVHRTDGRGYFERTLDAPAGTRVRVWSPEDRLFSPALIVE